MFYTPEQLKLSNAEKNRICEELWKDREDVSTCPDCAVKPGKVHTEGCDVDKCVTCGVQMLMHAISTCKKPVSSVWSGLWPGVKECYEQKLICFDTVTNQWCFDLNTLASLNVKRIKKIKV